MAKNRTNNRPIQTVLTRFSPELTIEKIGHSCSSSLLPAPSLVLFLPLVPAQVEVIIVGVASGCAGTSGGSVVKGDGLGWGRVVELDEAELGLDGYGG